MHSADHYARYIFQDLKKESYEFQNEVLEKLRDYMIEDRKKTADTGKSLSENALSALSSIYQTAQEA